MLKTEKTLAIPWSRRFRERIKDTTFRNTMLFGEF